MAQDNPNYPIGTASVSYIDPNNGNALTIHVFSTDGYSVTQRYTAANSNGWQTGSLDVAGGAVSATAWNDSGGSHIRVYATDEDTTTEWCWDPGSTSWAKGAYSNI